MPLIRFYIRIFHWENTFSLNNKVIDTIWKIPINIIVKYLHSKILGLYTDFFSEIRIHYLYQKNTDCEKI